MRRRESGKTIFILDGVREKSFGQILLGSQKINKSILYRDIVVCKPLFRGRMSKLFAPIFASSFQNMTVPDPPHFPSTLQYTNPRGPHLRIPLTHMLTGPPSLRFQLRAHHEIAIYL